MYARWTGYNGAIEEAQSNSGMSAIERYAGLGTGSGKLVLEERSISKEDFEHNKKKGVKTV